MGDAKRLYSTMATLTIIMVVLVASLGGFFFAVSEGMLDTIIEPTGQPTVEAAPADVEPAAPADAEPVGPADAPDDAPDFIGVAITISMAFVLIFTTKMMLTSPGVDRRAAEHEAKPAPAKPEAKPAPAGPKPIDLTATYPDLAPINNVEDPTVPSEPLPPLPVARRKENNR